MSDKSPTNQCLKTPEKINVDDTDTDAVNSSNKSPRVPSSASKKQQKEVEKAEKLRLKEEKEKLKLEEKVKKEKEKNDLKQKRESEKLEKEREKNDLKQKKESERIEKEVKRKQKEEEKKMKLEQMEEEKKKKEEAKQEEKKRKEDEKKREEEKLGRKTQKEKELMKNFFIKTAKDVHTPQQHSISTSAIGPFMPFEVKPGMRLAPLRRFNRHDIEECRAKLDDIIADQTCPGNYIDDLREGSHKPEKSDRTWPRDEDDILVVTAEPTPAPQAKRKMKLLQFHDNYRPAYYGTWSKTSRVINNRRPLAMDSKAFDYEVDSDEEWEEEEPGESISHSEGEDDGGDEDGGNDDNEDKFFVPHGYLSEGEGCDDDEDLSPEAMKQKQHIMVRNWEAEMKENVQRLRPISIGVVRWHENVKLKDDQLEFMNKFTARPINVTFPFVGDELVSETNENKLDKRHRVQGVPEEAMPELIKLVHGCGFGIDKMAKEFKHFWTINHSNCDSEDSERSSISKRQLEAKIREIASYKKDPSRHPYRLWYVEKEILEKYNALDAPVPTAWVWLNKPTAKKLPQITNPTCETPKQERIAKEMKTPNMTASPATCHGTNVNVSIKKFITPATADAVSSDNSAKRRVATTLLVTPLTPGENANLSDSFVSRRTQRKRSSSDDIQSESKRAKVDPKTIVEETSQDCVIIDDPVAGKKGHCCVQLFKNNVSSRAEDVVMVDDDVPANGKTDENGSVESNRIPTQKVKTMTNFFKTLSPLNK